MTRSLLRKLQARFYATSYQAGASTFTWDEAQFQEKLCLKLKVAANGLERGSLASFVADSRKREQGMKMLEKRLLLILEERKEIH